MFKSKADQGTELMSPDLVFQSQYLQSSLPCLPGSLVPLSVLVLVGRSGLNF